ncbi:hypothetical protein [Polaromonas sp.]|uniref:hypothetical protein n=1 Tax=Polaromonas sp. TaxID=1869339 RepID=UPI00273096D9|nr:hypothetical protein [Polaromonas sp.]MDP1740086.1 hypothetical protein [Polaromonas sp.]
MAGLSAAGAAAGTAIMPGIGTAIGGVVGAIADGFMGGGESASTGYTTQKAESAIYGDLGLDSSGWNVNFSGSQSNGSNKSAPSALDSIGLTGSGSLLGASGITSGMLIAGAAVLIGLVIWKKSRSKK